MTFTTVSTHHTATTTRPPSPNGLHHHTASITTHPPYSAMPPAFQQYRSLFSNTALFSAMPPAFQYLTTSVRNSKLENTFLARRQLVSLNDKSRDDFP
jgi:hypothetical protein